MIPLDLGGFSVLKVKHAFLLKVVMLILGANIKVTQLIFQIYVTGILLKFKDIKVVNCTLSSQYSLLQQHTTKCVGFLLQ